MKRPQIAGLGIIIVCTAIALWAASPEKPKFPKAYCRWGADGKPLNLDFETGTLKDWTATGDALIPSPSRGIKSPPARGHEVESPGRFLDRRV